MVLLYIVIISALILMVLLFIVASKIIVHFDSTSSDLNVTLLWLYPILKSVISTENDIFTLSIYIFSKRIFKKQLISHKTKTRNKNLLSKINPTDIRISAQYGFKDPCFTGLTFAALNMIPKFFALESLYQRPNFLASNDFININATAKLNLGRFLLELV
ncbi:hypothetical protein CACET_c30690 [Clostridium aceticum]|uniref:Uncharacterized protein n=1 Tax=Clostridium aceticum TaxID=84022 RepID=A0A0D8IBA7_9CLOT|nr:hypothetical protein [Clostridium aceticum]AKL96513.1 hypothetical protein CACET_c30690 [Clostridium aceticum]KJF27317.1 hypothetical protein TZ02_08240 [Clostridium aceticum]